MRGRRYRWAIGLAVLVACKGGSEPDDARQRIAELRVRQIAGEAYPQWQLRHAADACPSLPDLAEYLNSPDLRDPWGHDYALLCGPAAPPAAKGFGVRSIGPDGVPDTADDIVSWK